MKTPGSNRSLGVLSWMAMIGDTHNRLTTADFLARLRASLHTGQMEVLYCNERPLAWFVWRRPTPPMWRQLLTACGHAHLDVLPLQGQIWLDFWVRPFGCNARLAQAVGQCLQAGGVPRPQLNWHDPGVNAGAGALHLGVLVHELQGR